MNFKSGPVKRPAAFGTSTNPLDKPVKTQVEQPLTGPKAGPATRFGGIKKLLGR